MPDARPDSHEPLSPEELYQEALSLLEPIARAAFSRRHHFPSPDDVARLCDRLRFSLWKDDYHKLRSFKGEAQLSTWLGTVAYHEAIAFLKEARKHVPLEDAPPHIFDRMPEQEESLLHKEQEHLLAQAVLHKLTPTERELYELAIRQELKAEEVAKRMNVKKESVYSMKKDLKKKLEKLLNGDGKK